MRVRMIVTFRQRDVCIDVALIRTISGPILAATPTVPRECAPLAIPRPELTQDEADR
jgi:hypothetical protein